MYMEGALEYLNTLTIKYIKEGGGPGVCVGVVSDNNIYMENAYGTSNIIEDKKMDKNTLYLLASVSKPISGTTICYLQKKYNKNVLQKKANVQAHNEYLSDNIKIVDLLSHRSGIPEQYGSYKELVGYKLEKIMKGVKNIPNINFRNEKNYTNLPFTYGCKKACEYLNVSLEEGYNMLFNMIGMKNTSLNYEPGKYLGYFQDKNNFIPYFNVNYEEQVSAGGIYSNIIDMNKFIMFHLKNQIYDKQIIDDVYYRGIYVNYTEGNTTEGPGIDINYITFNGQIVKAYSHSGAVENSRTIVYWIPSINFGICILVNSSTNAFPEAAVAAFLEYLQTGNSEKADAVYTQRTKIVYNILKKEECIPFLGNIKQKKYIDTSSIDGNYYNSFYGNVIILDGKIQLGNLKPVKIIRKNNKLIFVLKNKIGIKYLGYVKKLNDNIEVLYNCAKAIYIRI